MGRENGAVTTVHCVKPILDPRCQSCDMYTVLTQRPG